MCVCLNFYPLFIYPLFFLFLLLLFVGKKNDVETGQFCPIYFAVDYSFHSSIEQSRFTSIWIFGINLDVTANWVHWGNSNVLARRPITSIVISDCFGLCVSEIGRHRWWRWFACWGHQLCLFGENKHIK